MRGLRIDFPLIHSFCCHDNNNNNNNNIHNNIYSFKKESRVYSLICFANELNENERSDRVIATKWDAAFTLYDGVPSKKDIDRLTDR